MILAHAPKLLVKPLLVLATLLGVIFVSAVPAAASAESCVWSSPDPHSCVQVIGGSNFVNSARGGVELFPRQSARGHFQVFDTDGYLYRNSDDQTYWNQSWWHGKTFWGPNITINSYFPNRDRVCSVFWERRGGGYVRHSPACVTIVR